MDHIFVYKEGEFDNYMFPLLKHLWRQGITTYFSCSGHKRNYNSAYLVFKYNRKFVNYLWKNNCAIERHYNSFDKKFQYVVRSDDFSINRNSKLCRDYFLLLLSKYNT